MEANQRLIDANKLPYSIAVDDNGKQIFYVKAEDIDKAPTVDTVEVVRCKDCKYWEDGYLGYCTQIHTAMDYDAFCSYGERRSPENE